MTLEEWHNTPSNRAELSRLLAEPALQRALDVILTANSPRFLPAHPLEKQALLHAFQGGVHHVPRMLDMLTRDPVSPAPVEGMEWMGAHVVTYPTTTTE